MQFKQHEVSQLIKACKLYQEKTGSEYMWDEYETLIEKLEAYKEEYSVA